MHIESQLATLASRHLHPQHIDRALDAFQKHLGTLDAKKVSAMHADGSFLTHADEFFGGVAEGNPALAAQKSTATAASKKTKAWAVGASKDELKKAGFGKW
jgi:hypothetical protein